MDKYEFNIKVEQIKKLVGKNDYDTAMKIADTIDWRRVRNTNLLSMVAMVYEKNEDYQEAKEILLQAFERAPIGKRLLYKLAELAIKEGNIEEAEAYYKEFGDLASEDPRQQLLRYMILKAKGAPAQQLIHSLEAYTSVELDEKWLYELAELYSLAGLPERCVETCDRIMLMFGLGKYVDKAMDLKVQYAPLTNYQKDLVENRDKYEARLRAVEQEYGTGRTREDRTREDRNSKEGYREANQEYEPEASYHRVPVEEHLEASIEEAAVQESLAMEVSKISHEEPVLEEESQLEHTRVLEDIRRFGRPSAAVSAAVKEYEAESAVSHSYDSEPVIEEEPENPGVEADSLDSYEMKEDLYSVNANGYDEPGEVNHDDADYGDTDYYDEDLEYENQTESEEAEEYCDHVAEETAWNYESEDKVEDKALEVEDLFEEEEEPEKAPVRNHLMIEAVTSEKGLKMAVEALKQIHKENGVNNPVAKISGLKLSQRSILACAEKLAAKDLIIEEAGDLSLESLNELNELMDRDTSGMIVVLIDTPQQMETLHREHPLLASKFECIGSSKEALQRQPYYDEYDEIEETFPENKSWRPANHSPADYLSDDFQEEDSCEEDFYEEEAEVEERRSVRNEKGPGSHGEEMELDEFAQYACRYANEIDCSITGKSMLALYERIEIMEEDGIPLNRSNAEALIEEAADRAEKPSFGKKIKNLFSNKYDKDGLLVLKEEHFIY